MKMHRYQLDFVSREIGHPQRIDEEQHVSVLSGMADCHVAIEPDRRMIHQTVEEQAR